MTEAHLESTAPISAPVAAASADPALVQRLHRLQSLATAAIVLALVGIGAALTSPLWVTKIYGDRDAARIVALGIAQLRPVLQKEEPFNLELLTLRRVVPNDPAFAKALETVAAFADSGAPTLPHLRASFVRVANEIMLADVVSEKNTWFDRAMVTVASTLDLHSMAHKINAPRDNSTVIWDAQAHLEAGDLPGAVAAVETLTGRPAELSRLWLHQAHQRIAAEQVLAQLDALAEQASASPLRKLAD